MAIKIVGDNVPLSKVQEAKEKGGSGINVVTMKDQDAEASIKDLQNQLNQAIVTMTQMIMLANSGDDAMPQVPPMPPVR